MLTSMLPSSSCLISLPLSDPPSISSSLCEFSTSEDSFSFFQRAQMILQAWLFLNPVNRKSSFSCFWLLTSCPEMQMVSVESSVTLLMVSMTMAAFLRIPKTLETNMRCSSPMQSRPKKGKFVLRMHLQSWKIVWWGSPRFQQITQAVVFFFCLIIISNRNNLPYDLIDDQTYLPQLQKGWPSKKYEEVFFLTSFSPSLPPSLSPLMLMPVPILTLCLSISVIQITRKTMTKVPYNHQLPFAFRFISHLDEQEAGEILSKASTMRDGRRSHSKQPQQQSKRKSQQNQAFMSPQETKILTEFNQNREQRPKGDGQVETRFGSVEVNKKKVKQSEGQISEKREYKDIADQLLSDFETEELSNVHQLKQSYLRLWYEKMAVQNNQSSMQAELTKRDEIINQLRQQLGHKGGQQVPAFFNPNTPLNSVSQNKTAFLPTQSNSLQSQTMTPQTSSSGVGHWNSLHPNRNINMAARSNM